MGELELEILKLQWHVQILQSVLAKVYVSAYRTSPETSASSPADDRQNAYRALLAELEAAQQLGYQTYLSPAVPKATLIPPDILSLTATPAVLRPRKPGEKGERP